MPNKQQYKKKYIINAMGMRSTKYGGLEKFMVALANELNKANFCLILIYNSEPQSKEFITDLYGSGGEIIVSHARHPLRYFLKFIRLFIKYNIVLVHTHFQNVYPIIFAKLLGSRKIFASLRLMITDTDYNFITNKQHLSYRARISKFIINKSLDHIFTVSEACKLQYISLFPDVEKKTERFYHGSLPNHFLSTESKKKYNLPSDKVIIGIICFNSPIKGLDILMDAIVILKNLLDSSNFLVVQIGIDPQAPENTDYISQCYQKGLNNEMVWFGIRNDVSEILPGFDIYCQSSRSEGLPLSIMEAGMAGLPIVGSKIGGIPEVVVDGYNGFLFNVGDYQQLAEYLYTLITNSKLRKSMGANSKDYMMSNFNLHNQAKVMFNKYIEIAKKIA